MQWTSIIVIYPLFWVMSAFFVLPFGVRTRALLRQLRQRMDHDRRYQHRRQARRGL